MLLYGLNSYGQSRLEYFSNKPVDSIHLKTQILTNTFYRYYDSLDYLLIDDVSHVLVLTNESDIIVIRNDKEVIKYGNIDLIISYKDTALALRALQNLIQSLLSYSSVIFYYLKAGGYIYLDSNKLIISFVNFYTTPNSDRIKLFLGKYKILYEIKGGLKKIR